MARVTSYHVLNHTEIRRVLSSPSGPVARDILVRCIRVEAAAKRELNSSPRRINTGRLRSAISHQLGSYGDKLIGRVGTNVSYARYVHDGTGLFGPHAQMIKPRQAKRLRFTTRAGEVVYAKAVKGMPPNPFLKKALKAAKK